MSCDLNISYRFSLFPKNTDPNLIKRNVLTKLLTAGETGGDKAVHTDIVELFLAVFQQQGCERQERF